MTAEKATNASLVAFEEGFLTTPLSPPDQVKLVGSKCRACGVALLGRRQNCENCAGEDMEDIVFSKQGRVYSYTVARYPSLPPYRPAEPYVPLVVAWVDLPEGTRIMTFIDDCQPQDAQIGMEVELVVEKGWKDDAGNDVMAFKFRPVRTKGRDKGS